MSVRSKRRQDSIFEIEESSISSVPRVRSRRSALAVGLAVAASDPTPRPLPCYSDCGDNSNVCPHCHSTFWNDERVLRLSTANKFVYTQSCKLGSVALPLPLKAPEELLHLYEDQQFLENIRAYNVMFSMTSFGARVDDTVNIGRGPHTFKIFGQISHWIGSLCPPPSEKPRFLQLYIYETENEVANRLSFYNSEGNSTLSVDIVRILSRTLHTYNEYVRTFVLAHETASMMNLDNYCVRLYNPTSDTRYHPPAPGSLGAIVHADDINATDQDIIVRAKGGEARRVSKLHSSYMPLQYSLLFPFGEDGWSPQLRLKPKPGRRPRRLSANMYYSFQIHSRNGYYSLLLNSGRLFQQYIVDAYVCIEQERLDFIRDNQAKFRSEYISSVHDAISRGDSEGKCIGKRVFLLESFVSGPRYMYQHYQDALAICRVYGNLKYFVTFTCNANWPEIRRFMTVNKISSSQNRPDIIACVFHIKVLEFITFLKDDKTLGDVVAHLYTIKFQKRGLPHCYTLVWITGPLRVTEASDVDRYISSEFPNPKTEPRLYDIVTKCMIHGPCSLLNPNARCMQQGQCTKSFPKPFVTSTFFDNDGYVRYKRDVTAYHELQCGIRIHNDYVVPYNKRLCSRFDAHINVEYCGWNMMIKYLFKYISKDVDRVCFAIQRAELSKTPNTAIQRAHMKQHGGS